MVLTLFHLRRVCQLNDYNLCCVGGDLSPNGMQSKRRVFCIIIAVAFFLTSCCIMNEGGLYGDLEKLDGDIIIFPSSGLGRVSNFEKFFL